MAECLDGCKERCEVFSHKRSCNCQEFTYPCFSITKIGVALHVKFHRKEGSYSYVDCDINIPTIPTDTRYNGDHSDAVNYLVKARPVGWLEEITKMENMSCENSSHLIGEESWQVKMRMINRDTVHPRQVSLQNISELR